MKKIAVAMCLFMAFFLAVADVEASIAILDIERFVQLSAEAGDVVDAYFVDNSAAGSWTVPITGVYAEWWEPPFIYLHNAQASASHHSRITLSGDTLTVDGLGTASQAFGMASTGVDGSEAHANAQSILQVDFVVSGQPVSYTWSFGSITGDAMVGLFKDGAAGGEVLGWTGTLTPGSYSLYANATASGGSNSFYQIGFTATSIPLPGAFWLLGSGLIGMIGIRRKYKT